MRKQRGLARNVSAIALCLAAVVATGCEWSGDSDPDHSVMFERTIDFYGSSRANGEYAQKVMVTDPKAAGQPWGWSRRFATLITDGEWSTPEQADFEKELKSLLLTWNTANYRALSAARTGNVARMRADLKQAGELETQIDELISNTDIESITAGEFSSSDFSKDWQRDAARLKEQAPWAS